jgi:hypothetical protein
VSSQSLRTASSTNSDLPGRFLDTCDYINKGQLQGLVIVETEWAGTDSKAVRFRPAVLALGLVTLTLVLQTNFQSGDQNLITVALYYRVCHGSVATRALRSRGD